MLLAVATLVLVGCSGAPDIVGKYKMSATMPDAKAGDPTAAMAQQMMESMTLEFKADKTFSMFMMEGTYTVSGDMVEMTPTGVMGMDASKATTTGPKTMRMKIEDGGKTLVPIDPSPDANSPKDAKFVRI